ncbi:MAG TPA: TetR/AcrR family transcriptional regulator [Solirubrobacteraceae bacterium]|nr:TetR/AcrR family transcriptional regulator [Solirubrobacteraceae bacterium]
MPTGTPIHDIREQLLAASQRLLLRNGPDALTSRAVTTEAGVAKGILHRYFPDFDAFLVALAVTDMERLDSLSNEMRAAAGEGTVAGNIARMLVAALTPATIHIINLVCSRHELRERLRLTTPRGIPLAAEITRMVAAYLTAERGLGRIAITTDVDMLAVLLVGGAHLRAGERNDLRLDPEDLRDLVAAAIGNALIERPQGDRT